MSRPEHSGPPQLFYNDNEAKKYSANKHIIEIQTKLTERALELLALPDDNSCFLLDIGCGSGLSGQCLSDNGHYWTGLDISHSMLDVAIRSEVEGDLILGDMGHGIPFRAGCFDGAISISAIQWLCNVDKKSHNPIKRLNKFFSTLYAILARGSRAVFQLYPETPEQLELITEQAMKAGFTGGIIVDYPNSSKAKKIFLCLFAGISNQPLPKALRGNEIEQNHEIKFESKREKFKGKFLKKGRKWILDKKERQRRQGKEVRHDTKYTGRKRPMPF